MACKAPDASSSPCSQAKRAPAAQGLSADKEMQVLAVESECTREVVCIKITRNCSRHGQSTDSICYIHTHSYSVFKILKSVISNIVAYIGKGQLNQKIDLSCFYVCSNYCVCNSLGILIKHCGVRFVYCWSNCDLHYYFTFCACILSLLLMMGSLRGTTYFAYSIQHT